MSYGKRSWVSITLNRSQGLIQKEKLDIDFAKSTQIGMLANKIDESIYHLGIQANHTLRLFFIFLLFYSHC